MKKAAAIFLVILVGLTLVMFVSGCVSQNTTPVSQLTNGDLTPTNPTDNSLITNEPLPPADPGTP